MARGFCSSSIWGCAGLGLGLAELCCGTPGRAAAGPLLRGLGELLPFGFGFCFYLYLSLFFSFVPSKVSLPVSRTSLGRDWQSVPKRTARRGCRCPGEGRGERLVVVRCGCPRGRESPGFRMSRVMRMSRGVSLSRDCRCPRGAGSPAGCFPVPGAVRQYRGEGKR